MDKFINDGKVIALTLDQANKIKNDYQTKISKIVSEEASVFSNDASSMGMVPPTNQNAFETISNEPLNNLTVENENVMSSTENNFFGNSTQVLDPVQTNADVLVNSLNAAPQSSGVSMEQPILDSALAPSFEPVVNQSNVELQKEESTLENNVSFIEPSTVLENSSNAVNGDDYEIEELRRNLNEIIAIAHDSIERVFSDYYKNHKKTEDTFQKVA